MHAIAESLSRGGLFGLHWKKTALVLVFFICLGWSTAAPAPVIVPPPLDPDRSWDSFLSRNENLMVKFMELDPLGLHGQGRMVLHSLHPLVTLITFEKVTGDPELWLKRMAGGSAPANWLLERQKLGEIKLSKLEVLMTIEGIDFRFERAETPDGHLSKGRGRFSLNGQWAIRTGPLWLARPPFKDMEKSLSRPMGYGSMDASGSRGRAKVTLEEAFALDASTGHAVVDALWNEAASKGRQDKVQAEVAVEMSTFRVNDAFFEQGPRELAHQLLTYSGLAPSWGMAFPRITLSGVVTGPRYHAQTLRLSSPNLQVWGEAKGLWSPPPGTLVLDLTAKSPGKDARNFTWSLEQGGEKTPGS
ncbi:MAG: hypothetical protein HW380_2675 [Magnetococcales bacterium]|nr:hypothetical protein [Magnetococcales bacterium]